MLLNQYINKSTSPVTLPASVDDATVSPSKDGDVTLQKYFHITFDVPDFKNTILMRDLIIPDAFGVPTSATHTHL